MTTLADLTNEQQSKLEIDLTSFRFNLEHLRKHVKQDYTLEFEARRGIVRSVTIQFERIKEHLKLVDLEKNYITEKEYKVFNDFSERFSVELTKLTIIATLYHQTAKTIAEVDPLDSYDLKRVVANGWRVYFYVEDLHDEIKALHKKGED